MRFTEFIANDVELLKCLRVIQLAGFLAFRNHQRAFISTVVSVKDIIRHHPKEQGY
jgi:hypothetical protein